MLSPIGKLSAAIALAGLILVLIASAKASAPDGTGVQVQRLAKADRLVFAKGTACSARGWPNYETNCLFDKRGAAEGMAVRVVGLH